MSGESEIREFLESRTRAHESKDIDAAMSLYAEDIVYYDAVAPLRFSGTEEVRANFLRWFDGYDGPIELETHELTIAVDGDVAFANMLHLIPASTKAASNCRSGCAKPSAFGGWTADG
ncbi:YybH family protein [Nocardia ignorata]|uniref:YybH family protein n=1 Tax=Nocardia ignorata TaxID=145285 RepID=UPI003626487E